jgi:2-amino-4-hydroxy-6-hydroxymethyldihydropteridine diphosphokinase
MRADPAAGVLAYVGIGSNLADPEAQVRRALVELAELPGTERLACSRLYRTAPVGPQDQPDYVNAAVCLRTRLTAEGLLAALQRVERAHGRVGDGRRWGPRTLDLDILLYGDACIDRPGLRVPHPQLANRAFVLVPLADIAPSLVIPGRGPLVELLARCPCEGVALLPGPRPDCELVSPLAESARPPETPVV